MYIFLSLCYNIIWSKQDLLVLDMPLEIVLMLVASVVPIVAVKVAQLAVEPLDVNILVVTSALFAARTVTLRE